MRNALIKYYKDEIGSGWVRDQVRARNAPIFLSPYSVIELYAWIAGAWRSRTIKRRRDMNKLRARVRRDIGNGVSSRPFFVWSPPEGCFDDAERLLLEYGVRDRIEAMDALHLAAVRALWSQKTGLTVVTSDKPVERVCRDLGISTVNPEEAGSPQELRPGRF